MTREEIASRADLSEIDPVRRDQALDALLRRAGAAFLRYAERDNQNHLRITFKNWRLLRTLGIYEETLLAALKSTRSNHHHDLATLAFLVGVAKPRRLRAAGEPLPGTGPFTLYRGVAGRGRARAVRGLSWTGSLDVAGFFAVRGEGLFGLADPAVFRAVVPKRHVLAYLNEEKGRGEEEFLVQMPRSARVERVPESLWRPAAERRRAGLRRPAGGRRLTDESQT